MKFNIKIFHYILASIITIFSFFLYITHNEAIIVLGIFPWLAIEAIWFFVLKYDTFLDNKLLNLLFTSLFLFTILLPFLEFLFFNTNFFSINKDIVNLLANEVPFFILYVLLIIFFLLYFLISLIFYINFNSKNINSISKLEKESDKKVNNKIYNEKQGVRKDGFLVLPEIKIKPFIPEEEKNYDSTIEQFDSMNSEIDETNLEFIDVEKEEINLEKKEKKENNKENEDEDDEGRQDKENKEDKEAIEDIVLINPFNITKDKINKDNKNNIDNLGNIDINYSKIDENDKDDKDNEDNKSDNSIESESVLENNKVNDIIDNTGIEEKSEIERSSDSFDIDELIPKTSHPHFENIEEDNKIIEEKGAIILKTLKDFGIESKLINYIKGPVVTRFELEIDEKVNLGKIVNLEKNITYNLSAEKIRILAPIPGKKAVGIEIPNEIKQIVYFSDLARDDEFKDPSIHLPFILGKDIEGKTIITDISKSPHLLIAGRTGSGKSVCINTLISSLVIANPPEKVRLLLIDPKRVELSLYNDLPHLLTDEIIIFPEDASAALKWLVAEMENRYSLLKEQGFRSIEDYNDVISEKLPYLVLIIDEFYALMQTAQKIIEDSLIHLSAMARAVGIHLIFATQRPSAEVVTGVIKSNLPSRIAFQTFSKTDSRIILDTSGAESLLGNGDMLFSFAGLSPVRIQGAFISTNEVRSLVQNISLKYKTERKSIDELFAEIKKEDNQVDEEFTGDDPLYPQAIEIVKKERKISASYLQRRLKIGYNRAARIVEQMEDEGLISPLIDGKKREIYI